MIHRITMYKGGQVFTGLVVSMILMFCIAFTAQATELDSSSLLNDYYTRVVPQEIDDQIIYPTNFAVLAMDPLQVYAWQSVEVPLSWVKHNYNFEIWDGQNQIVNGFGSQKIKEKQIDLSTIDASLHPQIRLVVFRTVNDAELDYSEPVVFSFSEQRNVRLIVFSVFVAVLMLSLFVGAVRYRVGFRELVTQARVLFRGKEQSSGLRQSVVYGLLIIIWSGIFGVSLGLFIGGVQIIYLLIKVPVLFLSAFMITVCSNVVLSYMLGVKNSLKELVTHSLSVIAVTALCLAACSPIVLFFICVPQQHDELLISVVMLFCIAGLLGAVRFFDWLRQHKGLLTSVVVTLVWVCIYGIVVMQLAWMLRPWVGVVDPVHETVPFSRMYGGNVFVELMNTTKRL